MSNLIVVDPKEYGLTQEKANSIDEAFREPIKELAELETEYAKFENLVGEPPEDTCKEAKALKQRYVKIRTTTEKIHKEEKSFFLGAGRYVDAWKNRQKEIGKVREDKLSNIADYYVNLEKERIEKIRLEREAALRECTDDPETMYIPPDLGNMEDRAWSIYLSGIKTEYERQKAEEAKAEQERIEAEKREREENERIRKENERLQKEAEKREKELQKEREKAEAERKEAEEKARKEREAVEEKARKEREEMEAKLAAERAEREKIERERREKEEAEAKAKAEEEERQRKAAAAPDKEKLKSAIDYISAFPLIKVQTKEAQEILEYTESKLKELSKWIFNEIQEL